MPRLLVDVEPLRRSRQYRLIYTGQAVSFLGSQLTVVAIPFQVYDQTGSSLAVGLVSLAQVVPLLLGSLLGGAIADSMDRRRLLLVCQVLLAVTIAGLAVNAMLPDPALWPLFVLSAVAAALSGADRPARSATIPTLVDRRDLPAANALWQIQMQIAGTLGPAVAGLLLARFGLGTVYWIDVASFVAAFVAVWRMDPVPPHGGGTKAGLASIVEGLRFIRGRQALQGTFVIDLDAMVFGLPRALFPAIADQRFHGGAGVVGLLFAAPGAGALLGAVFTGWVGRVQRQGRAVLVAVAVWGAACAAFGLSPWLWPALLFLAVAGAADVVSAVFRNTILQTIVPDSLRGRLSAIHIAVVTGGPRLGDAESGAVAALTSPTFSAVSGGVLCLAGVAATAVAFPALGRYRTDHPDLDSGQLLDADEGVVDG